MLVLRIRHVPGKRDPVTARRAFTGYLGVAAEAMDHDALGGAFIEQSHDVGPRIPDVDDHRLARFARQPDMRGERPDPILPGRGHAEGAEPALTHARDRALARGR